MCGFQVDVNIILDLLKKWLSDAEASNIQRIDQGNKDGISTFVQSSLPDFE